MNKVLYLCITLCVLFGSCVDPFPDIDYGPQLLPCDTTDTAAVDLMKGCLAIPCDGSDCYLDNYYASIANLFPTNCICNVLAETFWGTWGSEFYWDTELLNGKKCANDENQTLNLFLNETNYSTKFSFPDYMECVPAFMPPDILPTDCKHTMTLRYYSILDERSIIWTKVWMPGEGVFYSNHEEYEVCEDSNEPLIGQPTGIGELHNVYINNQFEEVRL